MPWMTPPASSYTRLLRKRDELTSHKRRCSGPHSEFERRVRHRLSDRGVSRQTEIVVPGHNRGGEGGHDGRKERRRGAAQKMRVAVVIRRQRGKQKKTGGSTC
eukprot:866456-Rhodomonas_salina.2